MNLFRRGATALIATAMLFSSCNKDEEAKKESDVELLPSDIIISKNGTSSYEEVVDDDKSTDIVVKFGKKLKKDIFIEFEISQKDNKTADGLMFNSDSKLVKTLKITLKKGETQIKLKIKRNKARKLGLTKNVTYIVKITKITGKDVDVSKIKTIEIIIKPKPTSTQKYMRSLTEDQKKIVAKYPFLKKWLGRVEVTSEITRDGDNDDLVDAGFPLKPNKKTYTGYSMIVLGENATLAKPILKMKTNPMGLTDFYYMVFKNLTLNFSSYGVPYFAKNWDVSPVFSAIMNVTKWTKTSDETFTGSLENLLFKPTAGKTGEGTVDFVSKHAEYDVNVVNIKFAFSAWERFLEARKNGDLTARTVDNLWQDGVIDPHYVLYYSPIDLDDWGDDMYIAPTSSYNASTGETDI